MKKFILIVALFVSAVASVNAQNYSVVEGNRLFNNTSVSLYGGATGWLNSSVNNSDTFINGVRPSFGLSVAKQFTPSVGVELFGETSVNSFPFSEEAVRWTAFDFSNIGLNGTVNLNNLFHGYRGRPDRVEVVPFIGMGWMHGYTTSSDSNITTEEYAHSAEHAPNFISANFGQRIDFNMGKARAWQINVKPSLSYMIAGEGNQVEFNANRAYATLQVGATYKFGYKNSKGVKTHNFTSVPVPYFSQKEVDDAVIEALQKREPVVVKETVTEKIVERVVETKTVEVKTPLNPTFEQGKTIVDATSLSYLDAIAADMNATDKNYTLTGYASLEGTEAVNNALSLKRAEAIKKCLVDRGVDASRLTTVAGGATDKFGPRYEQNRIVVVE